MPPCEPGIATAPAWVRVARGILAADANEIKTEARSHVIVRRVLKRLSLEFGRTGALRWIENPLAYQDPSLYFMHDERALYAYAQPIALRWEQRPELRNSGGGRLTTKPLQLSINAEVFGEH